LPFFVGFGQRLLTKESRNGATDMSQESVNGQRLTTPQLARRYQVTTRTVQTWRDQKRIPFIRINARCIRYDPDAVERALSK
jgi:hypothetical protein